MSENETSEPPEEPVISLYDAVMDDKEQETKYAAVYGNSDENACTYGKGYIKRQALYACLTCCPDSRNDPTKCAGICLACSHKCHENHELIELYTKRNFRCDCPTESFPEIKCALNSDYDMEYQGKKFQKNAENLYNHNFWGLYCTCERPYPDPENSNEDEMLQCEICEDWYHIRHLQFTTDIPTGDNDYELICGGCMTKYEFLQDYTGLAVSRLNNIEKNAENASGENVSVCDDKLKSDLDKSISEIMNISSVEADANEASGNQLKTEEEKEKKNCNQESSSVKRSVDDFEESESKRLKLDDPSVSCCRPKIQTDWKKGSSIFFPSDWRNSLCKCPRCISMYETEKIAFLLDAEDSVKNYEERGINQLADLETKAIEQCLGKLGRAQQIDAIMEYNRFKDKLSEFLQSFVASNKVVTEADVNQFFQEMRKTRNSNIGQPYFCR